ncbi:MAG: phosphate ABC transporter permease PstA [Dehalococcoidia bacterium]|nr:phosphate ABC transporter permease PstA [Dehalococcoidia bacterium]
MINLSPKFTQKLAWSSIWTAGVASVLILLFIIGYVLTKGLSAISPEFLFTAPEGGLSGEGGISSCIVATLWLILITMAILIPLGIGAAIYLAEYAPDNKFSRLIRYSVELLAGVPSIVFGLFGFAIFVLALHFNYSILAGALTLVCLLLPFLMRSAEEAMKAVPQYQREAALALGATKWQTVVHVILPAAMPGIITGITLCVGGVVAESACLYVTMGGSAAMPTSFLSGGRTLAVHVFYLAMETNALDKALATGAVLIILILILNFITRWLSQHFQAKMSGGI